MLKKTFLGLMAAMLTLSVFGQQTKVIFEFPYPRSVITSSVDAMQSEEGYIAPSDIQISDGVMTPEVMLSFGRISDPQLSPEGKRIMYGVSYTSIEENRQCRNLFICDVDGSNKVQLTKSGSSITNARWSADGKSIYYLKDGQLYKALLSLYLDPLYRFFHGAALYEKVIFVKLLHNETRLSNVASGISAFELSPDQKSVLFISTVKNKSLQQAADIDPKLDKAQAYVTEDLMYRHWDHWVTETPRTYLAKLNGDTITAENAVDLLGDEPYELPAEPFGGAEQLCWSPDGQYVAYACRKLTGKQYAFSTNTEIYIYSVATGRTVQVSFNGGYDTDPVWSPDGQYLAWISMPRNGYEADKQRLMVIDVQKVGDELVFSNLRDLTKDFQYDAFSPVWSPNSKWIDFSSCAKGTEKIFCASLDGEISQVTKDDWMYDFSSPFAIQVNRRTNTRTLYASYCSMNMPTELVSLTLEGKKPEPSFRQITDENGHILSQLKEPTFESVIVKTVDGQDMHCWVLYPPEFDSTKKYPAIEYALGGPQGTNTQSWSYRWCYRLMAQQGYVVMRPNRRGTTAFGQVWKEQISGDYSGLNMQDYLSAARYMRSKPYVSKLACVGSSYGGYSAYMLEGMHGDLFDCFVAHAGIFNEKMFWYTTEEMWFANWENGGLTEYQYKEGETGPAGDGVTFGGMQQAGAPYATTPKAQHQYANDPSAMATQWHTPILCIHGMKDFRIPYEQGIAAFNTAQMMGVPSKLVLFPEETHWVLQPQNVLLWHREFYDWLNRWMK